MTTKDIIKILPFESQLKNNLLNKFDTLSDDQRYTLEQILWDAYYDLYEIKLDENLRLAFARAKDGQENLDPDFYKRVENQTEIDMQKDASEHISEKDLEAARVAMQKIVNEMQLAKTQAKP